MKPEKFWDFLAPNFDVNEGDPAQRQDLKIIQRYLHPDDLVLEYACGTGTLALHLAGWVKEIHGIDISGKMIAAAQRKAAERMLTNTRFTHTTIDRAGYPGQSFDVVLAFNILHMLEDAPAAVGRIYDLLKPGGVFISSTPCLGEKRSMVNSLLSPLFMVPSRLGIIPYVKVFKASELEDLLTRGNFQIIEAEKFVGGLTEYLIIARKIEGKQA